jgi:hypothetical protein
MIEITSDHISEARSKANELGMSYMQSNKSLAALANAAQAIAEAAARVHPDSIEAEQSEFISAEQARALGAGGAQYLNAFGHWCECSDGFQYPTWRGTTEFKYRAIKQPAPRTTVNGESMTVEAAEKLKEKLGDTVDWFDWSAMRPQTKSLGTWGFSSEDFYAYTPKQPKLKPLDWSKMPIGVMTDAGIFSAFHWGYCIVVMPMHEMPQRILPQNLCLAPASEQPWLYWGGGECPVPEGCTFEVTLRDKEIRTSVGTFKYGYVDTDCEVIAYRITGVASGYTDGGAV